MLTATEQTIWLAGLLEGEGSFGTNGQGKQPLVRLVMTDLDVVERAAASFPGATNVRRQDRSHMPNRKDAYNVAWCGKVAADLMWAILPFMGTRRTDKMLTVLSDWMEDRMRICACCSREFSVAHWRTNTCSEGCNQDKRNRRQNAAYAARKEGV